MWFKKNFILILIILIGALFRFFNPNWDEGHYFHPDERNIAASVSRIQFFSQMNPKFFAYGSFPVYLYRVTGDVLNRLTKNKDWAYDWAKINVVGRIWSAIFSSLALIFVFKLAELVFDNKTAKIALFLASFTVFLIQTAHFAVTESLLTFFIVLISYLSILLYKKPSIAKIMILSILCGLALSTKISALTFFLTPALTLLLLLFKNLRHKKYRYCYNNLLEIFIFLAYSLSLFAVISPFIFLDFKDFKGSMNYEGGIATGKLVVCYVYQFINTKPYVYWIKNWFFTQGAFLALASIFGSLYVIYLAIRKKSTPLFLLVAWPVVYFAIVGQWFTKFVRYLAPLYPFLAIFSAKLLVDLERISKKLKKISLLVLLTTFLYAWSFMSIYFFPQTRILASDWVYRNIPSGAKILTEHWDDGLPIPLSTNSSSQYQIEALTIYEPDNQRKANYYAEKLSGADYIIINSRRLYGTLINLPEKYPITSFYYKFLFSGKLGYDKVAQFTSYPRLQIGMWKIEFNDDGSEESFQVYDHPKVSIFKNSMRLNRQEIYNILDLKNE